MKQNCFIKKFNLPGYACTATNTLYVIDQNGVHAYMPLDVAKKHREFRKTKLVA